MATWFGSNFPFFRGNTQLGVTSKVAPRQEDARLIKNDLLQGLLTLRGERLFRPGFGGDIGRFVFDQNDIQTYADLEQAIRGQVQTYHSRVQVTRIDTKPDATNPNAMIVTVFGFIDLEATNEEQAIATFIVPIAGILNNNG